MKHILFAHSQLGSGELFSRNPLKIKISPVFTAEVTMHNLTT